jgi:hypothetical protein
MQHERIMLSFLSCSLVQFMQPRRSAPTEGNNVTVKPDCGRVTAIPYSWLATRLRSLAIIIHTPIYCHLSPCFISKMYFSYWKPVGVSERMWSVNSDASISEEYHTLGGHSCWPSEYMGALATRLGAPGWAGNKLGSAGDKSGSTFNHWKAVWEKPHLLWERCWCACKS